MSSAMPDPAVPAALNDLVGGFVWTHLAVGQSPSQVYRLTADDRPVMFVKVQKIGHTEDLAEEGDQLDWLAGTPIPAPEQLLFVTEDDHEWLVMTGVAGTNAVDAPEPPVRIVAAMSDGLRQLHALNPSSCPFDGSLDRNLERACQNLERGCVDEQDFDADHAGIAAPDLFARLLAERPDSEDIVPTHGDASLSNVMIHHGAFAGFVDCGRLGRADRYQDLAIACRSISSNLGKKWVAPFLEGYGIVEPDNKRMTYFRLLDEFF